MSPIDSPSFASDPHCLFCKIITGTVPATFVYQDEHIVAFKDIHPKAAVHVLVVPRLHVAHLLDAKAEHQALLGHLMLTLPHIAKSLDLEAGFRVILNTKKGGGQEIDHLHAHLLGGTRLPGFSRLPDF